MVAPKYDATNAARSAAMAGISTLIELTRVRNAAICATGEWWRAYIHACLEVAGGILEGCEQGAKAIRESGGSDAELQSRMQDIRDLVRDATTLRGEALI